MHFVKTTILGGIVFLVPIVMFVFIIGKAVKYVRPFTAPLTELLNFGPVVEALIVNLVGIAVIVLVCFLGGMIAKSHLAVELVGKLESGFLSKIPVYAVLKGTVSSTLKVDDENAMKPVLAHLDDCSQIGFEIERVSGGKVAVFLPGAPEAKSGSVCFFTEDRVTSVDASFFATVRVLQGFGKGSDSELNALSVQPAPGEPSARDA